MNSDLSDIASGLSGCVTKDGQTVITQPIRFASGSVGLPGISFVADPDTGIYRRGANELGFSTAGAAAGYFDSAQKFFMLGAADIAGLLTGVNATLSGLLTLSSTSHYIPSTGTTAQRPGSPVEAYSRYNTTLHTPEWYNGSGWQKPATANPPPASFQNLAIKVASNTTVTVTADFVTTSDGTASLTTPVSATCNLGTNGAVNALDAGSIAVNTWYAMWVIAKADGTTGTLASTSFTSPTLPTDYTFKARVGAVQTINGSATLYGTWQLGRQAQYVNGLAQTTTAPQIATGSQVTFSTTSPTLANISVVRFVPPTANKIFITIYNGYQGGAPSSMLVAPSTAWGGTNRGPSGSAGQVWPVYRAAGDANTALTAELLLESTNIAWCSDNAGGAISCLGWEDNI
jgi:hypothetical protein